MLRNGRFVPVGDFHLGSPTLHLQCCVQWSQAFAGSCSVVFSGPKLCGAKRPESIEGALF